MLNKTDIIVSKDIIDKAISELPDTQFRFTFNKPAGNFFYDPWVIKPEFENTAWYILLKTLPPDIGEARIIKLDPGKSYVSHSDIDDRYHLNLAGDKCFLIDLDNQSMFPLLADCTWYDMDASPRHTATNFGNTQRLQLVVRKLLTHPNLKEPVKIKILSNIPDLEDRRFAFDDSISQWLNIANKRAIIDNFSYDLESVSFDIENSFIQELSGFLPQGFFLEVR
jgi:hypothetical protein